MSALEVKHDKMDLLTAPRHFFIPSRLYLGSPGQVFQEFQNRSNKNLHDQKVWNERKNPVKEFNNEETQEYPEIENQEENKFLINKWWTCTSIYYKIKGKKIRKQMSGFKMKFNSLTWNLLCFVLYPLFSSETCLLASGSCIRFILFSY